MNTDLIRIRVFCLGAVVFCQAATLAVAQQGWTVLERTTPVAAYANGRRLETEALMLKSAGRTLLPMRALFESLGAEVGWNAEERAVTAWTPQGLGVRFVVGKDRAQRLSRSEDAAVSTEWRLDTPAMLIAGKVYVPVRAATEALAAHVRWVESEPAIYLTSRRSNQIVREPDEPGVEITEPGSEPPAPPATPRPATPNPAKPPVKASDATASFEVEGQRVRLTLDVGKERFRTGETVPLQLTVTNVGDGRLNLRFRNGQRYEFQVRRGNTVIWNWSHGRLFTQALSSHALGPEEEVVFNADWTQRSNVGRAVTSGLYTVRGILTAGNGDQELMVEKQIRIDR